jgi:hypothetical protein
MLAFLEGKASDRKQRLLLCGLCRRVWYQLKDRRSRRAVEVAERYSDALASPQELEKVCAEAWDTWVNWPRIDAVGIKAVCATTWVARPVVSGAEVARVLDYSLAAEVRLPQEDARRDRSDLVRCLFGTANRAPAADASWLSWKDRTIPRLAAAIYEERQYEDLPILADALEEAGYGTEDILRHCRQTGKHGRGCWVVDLLLGKS